MTTPESSVRSVRTRVTAGPLRGGRVARTTDRLAVVHHSSIVYERELLETIEQARGNGRLDEHDQPVDEQTRRLFAELGERMLTARAQRETPDGIAGGLTLMDRVIVPAVGDAEGRVSG